jgi:hypothetical protein
LKGNEPSAYNGPSRSRERTSDVTPKGHKQNYNSAPRPRSNTNTHTGPSRQNLNNSFNHADSRPKNVNSSKNFNNSRVNAPRQSGGNRNNSGSDIMVKKFILFSLVLLVFLTIGVYAQTTPQPQDQAPQSLLYALPVYQQINSFSLASSKKPNPKF